MQRRQYLWRCTCLQATTLQGAGLRLCTELDEALEVAWGHRGFSHGIHEDLLHCIFTIHSEYVEHWRRKNARQFQSLPSNNGKTRSLTEERIECM